MIEAAALSKQFGGLKAVTALSLKVPNGKITGLLGPNGSGKSTTMRMICGLMAPDKGTVTIDGFSVFKQPLKAKQRLGVVPDSRGLYTRLTARENLVYYGQLQGVPAHTLSQRIAKLAEDLDMGDLLARRTEGFSQGQRVKVAIARAMIGDPPNLMLDEPSNGLDVMSTRALRRFLLQKRDAGKAILLSTHVMQEVVALCDHVIIIADGTLRAAGSAEQLMDQARASSLEEAFVSLIGTDEGLMA
ncbi:Na+ ABC transporter ATP-binding protein [Luminiphilus syltensis NOR5-1B]|uniref:Na+ ABC transporter ATP-binding protein n=1 Tax=Luminiphilus syltensis NOR5-1B TaxID=565045 RepID=B8KX53_9GAMM|nr:ATP-binding cassette domain-containing protein [Luminiphilus syltensis]EED36893.1 Na+ ABC transporter ATP-binding protein [Luminiphilus syltensis NOR5-1B]